MLRLKKYFLFICLFSVFGIVSFAQTPTSEEAEKILTEEIKLNVSAFDINGQFVSDLRKEDLVIIEDERLHQASSARRVSASVLIVLDTGGEMRPYLSGTRAAAENLVKSLQATDYVSVFQSNDKVEMLSDWTNDKAQVSDVLEKKMSFGRRSVFNQALDSAIKFFYKTPLENRHLVLVTNGADSINDSSLRDSLAVDLAASDINVHVISYTNLQKDSIASRKAVVIEGEWKPKRLPEEIVETLPEWRGPSKKKKVSPPDMAKMPRLGSITLDGERIRRAKNDLNRLESDEQFLTALAEDTNGRILLPETLAEMVEKTTALAQIIDSQYVVTYSPKRPLKDSPGGEVRLIEVSSKRAGLHAKARRKLVVKK